MGKYGINVPKGIAVSSAEEIKKAIHDAFPNEKEVISFSSAEVILLACEYHCIRGVFVIVQGILAFQLPLS